MERSITYESTEEALADIYGTSFKRVNWINKGNKYRSKFNKVSDIIAYIDDEADDTAKFISMYSNADGTILFDKIFLDFDISTDDILAKELGLIADEIAELSEEEKAIKLNEIEETIAEETSGLNEEETRRYYSNKYENRYFITPVDEAKKTALYLKENFNTDSILNASGSKGTHLRILLEPMELENPKEVLIKFGKYLQSELNLETIDPAVTSSYNRLERIPTSKHNKTKLYGNFFRLDTSYLDILDNMEHKGTDILPFKVDKTANTLGLKDLLIKFDNEASKEKKKDAEVFDADVKYTFNGTEEELATNFKIMYRQGHRNLIGYKMIHLLRRSGWTKQQTKNFFKSLNVPKCYDKNVRSWIDTAYDIKINNPNETRHLGGLHHFVSGIEEEAPADRVDYLKEYFINYFSKDKYVIWDKIKFNGKDVIASDNGVSFYFKTISGKDYYLRINPDTHKLQFEERTGESVLEIGFGHQSTKTVFERHKDRAKYLAEDLELEDIKSDELEITKLINKIVKSIRSEKQLKKIFTSSNTEDNIINIVRANPTDTKVLIRLSDKVETEFNIKRHINQSGKGIYYYNNGNYFKPISTALLGTLIRDEYDLKLPDNSINTILTSIQRNDKLNRQILQFKNCYLDRDTLEEVTPNENDIIVKKIGIKNLDTGKFTLLEYNPNAKSFNPEETQTYTEKVLKEILIPKEEPEETSLYYDRLERFGANVTGRNKYKTVTFYYTRRANAGKSVLNKLNSLIFNDNFSIISLEDLDDKFNYEIIGNKHILVIDETDKSSLENAIPQIKLLRSPNPRKDYRVMYGADKLTISEFGNLEIYSNVKPDIPLTEEALFYSIDLLELPNTFLEEREAKKHSNAYVLDPETYANLEKDIAGLTWLVSASINEFKSMEAERRQFRCRQSTEETIDKFLNADELLKFLNVYTEFNPNSDEWIPNKEIAEAYKNYLDVKGYKDSRTPSKLTQDIGKFIPQIHADFNINVHRKRLGTGGTQYLLKLKDIDDVEKEFKEVYLINEDLSEREVDILTSLSGDKKTVYNAIKDGHNTYNKINSKYTDIDTIAVFRELLNLNLIERSGTFNLTEY